MACLLYIVLIINTYTSTTVGNYKDYYRTESGQVSFASYAPLETIKATSNNLKGIINPVTKEFAFSLAIPSFSGFNSPLQKDHFNENFMESNIFPSATFSGKIIERIDFSKNGRYKVRTKGKFKIHGIIQERIIKSNLIIKDDILFIESEFTVILKEHNILIPKIVNQKIAKEIIVNVNAEMRINSE